MVRKEVPDPLLIIYFNESYKREIYTTKLYNCFVIYYLETPLPTQLVGLN